MSIEGYIKKHINKENFVGKNVFISGGNSGIGFELANHVLSLGANVYLLCRNLQKANIAKEELLKRNKDAHVNIIELDLANLESIRKAVFEIKKYDVDFFINNAGIFRLPKSTTKDGFEIIMGTNYIGNLYLNDLLIPHFKSLNHQVKIVFETSITSKLYKINYDDFFLEKKYKEMKIYAYSKVAINNMYFNYIDENKNTNIDFSLVHPGGTYTPLIIKGYQNKLIAKLAKVFMKLVFHSPKKASLCLLKAMDDNKYSIYGPRGIFELSGYPHKSTFKKNKQYRYCVLFARNLIASKVGGQNE